MKILIDMNLSPRWVDFFSEYGIEALHWTTVGEADALDTEIMAYARQSNYII